MDRHNRSLPMLYPWTGTIGHLIKTLSHIQADYPWTGTTGHLIKTLSHIQAETIQADTGTKAIITHAFYPWTGTTGHYPWTGTTGQAQPVI